MPLDERIVVVKQGGDGKLAIFITAIGGIAAAIWWFFLRGGGTRLDPKANLQAKLMEDGFYLGDVKVSPESLVAAAKSRGKAIDLYVSGAAIMSDFELIKRLADQHQVILNIAEPPASTVVGGNNFYRLGNS